ncbi:phosphoadenylyl-sulfate reductase [Propionibacterium sp.]|uniref:phosphoadenylyl-sulfate reductase n=1 Tax=Propionibacterium sp. TaxID=1977903 RepID=UPI0039EB6C2B
MSDTSARTASPEAPTGQSAGPSPAEQLAAQREAAKQRIANRAAAKKQAEAGKPESRFESHGPGRRRSAAELKYIADEAAVALADASAEDVALWAHEQFGEAMIVACSMAGDTVLPHLIAQYSPGVDVLFLNTGYHFAETIGTRDALEAAVDVNIIDALPELSVAEQDAEYGEKLYARNPTLCCKMRKVEPINRELAGYEAWVTGIRREDNAFRSHAQLVEWDETHQMVKLNPLAAWSFDDMTRYASEHQVPVNLLLTEGYPSIGCEPCTKPVAPGEDPRSGRWAGVAKTECGIHL